MKFSLQKLLSIGMNYLVCKEEVQESDTTLILSQIQERYIDSK